LAALFVILPALQRPGYAVLVWRGIFLAATAGSFSLIVSFASRAIQYRQAIAAGGDPVFYLRTGGLLHHWMVYSTVEVLVFGALLEFRAAYPEERRWATPALAVNCVAILLSLTRSLWLGCLVLLGLHVIYRRSKRAYAKWTWAVAAALVLLILLALRPIRNRIVESVQPDYYSNAERLQMWRVGWKMIREQPVFGVGPGRVEELYARYLSPGEPVPAYHGHLHNNGLQLAAQFGIPVLGAAVLCLSVLLKDLMQSYQRAPDHDARFLCRSGLLGVAGFLTVGMMDYTYGHSLGLILLGFVALAPLTPARRNR
jgi:O-antigen ligase